MKEQLAQIGNRALNAVAYGAIAVGITASIIENAHEAAVVSSVDSSMDKFIKEHDDYHAQFPDSNTMPVGIVPNNYTEEMLKADPIETFRRGQAAKKSAEQENDAVLWYGLSAAGVALQVFRRGRKVRNENKKLKTHIDMREQQFTRAWDSSSALIGTLRHETAASREREKIFYGGLFHFANEAAVDIPREVVDQALHNAYRVVPPVRQPAPAAAPAQVPAALPVEQPRLPEQHPAPIQQPEVIPTQPVERPERPPVAPPVARSEAPQRQPESRPTPAAPPAVPPQSNAERWLRGRRQTQIPDGRPPRRERRPDHDE